MNQEKYLRALLEYRDTGQQGAMERVGSESDTEVMADLVELDKLRAGLRSLPDEHPPASVWRNIETQLESKISGTSIHTAVVKPGRNTSADYFWKGRTPLAFAAGVFLATMFSVLLLSQSAPELTQLNSIDQLIAQSQDLERAMQVTSPRYFVKTGTWGALVQRVSEIDARLSELAYQELSRTPESEQLWQQRVNLMRSMIAMERPGNGVGRRIVL